MAIAIIGRKIGMTQFFDNDGNRIPVTVIEAGPCPVLKVKSNDGRDGYDAVVLGLDKAKEKHVAKPQLGMFKKIGTDPVRVVREVRVTPDEALLYPEGGEVDVSLFQPGEKVDVTGKSRGRGFAGVIKRHGFHGTSRTHGTHEVFRHGGSIGNSAFPGRVIKGKKMPGHYGNATKTILNLRVVAVFPNRNLMMVEGAIPGSPTGLVTVRKTVKTRLKRQTA